MKRGRSKTLPSSVPGHASDNASRQGQAEGQLFRRIEEPVCSCGNYPELKASEHLRGCRVRSTQLKTTSRTRGVNYNAVVRDFNTRVQSFPTNIIAGMFGFHARQFF